MYMFIDAVKFTETWWSIGSGEKKKLLGIVNEYISDKRPLLFRKYISLRYDSDMLFWIAVEDPEDIAKFRVYINSFLYPYLKEIFSMLSIYEPSPYVNSDIKQFTYPPKKYFIAYPMKKEVEWYLLPFEERKRIMAEHIGMARSHPEAKDILSYTTYSFGLGDQEYVVIYETDSLLQWSHVTEKLREAQTRRWIVKEEPILVGKLFSDDDLAPSRLDRGYSK